MFTDFNLDALPPVMIAMMTGWAGLMVAAISPGPNMFAVVATSLGNGLIKGLQVNLGIALGAFIWAALVNLGLVALFELHPGFQNVLMLLGGSYLLFLAFKGFRSAFSGGTKPMISSDAQRSFFANVLHGLAVTMSNPKVALFWASISALITTVTTDKWALMIFALGASLVVFTVYGTYALVFSNAGFQIFYQRFRPLADGLFGVVFLVLGLIVLSGLRV